MGATVAKRASPLLAGALAAAAALMLAAGVTTVGVIIGQSTCATGAIQAEPSHQAHDGIPANYLALYRHAGARFQVPWQVLAGIGAVETDHGRAHGPGVRAGVNAHGCCAGPMQFNLRDGPPSTWARYRVDGNHDGDTDVYDPADAIPSAANYLRALLRAAGGNLSEAILGYNHSQPYVNDVLAHARAYTGLDDNQLTAFADDVVMDGCAGGGIDDAPAGPAELRIAQRATDLRLYRALPAWALAGGRAAATVDARLYADAVWLLRRYHLQVTAAVKPATTRTATGPRSTSSRPTAPPKPPGTTPTGRLASDLGWTPACARDGTRPACPLAPAIQFVGYDGYPGHGSPRTCSRRCHAHLHVSWASPCYGTSGLSPPCTSVIAFPVPQRSPPPSWRDATAGCRASTTRSPAARTKSPAMPFCDARRFCRCCGALTRACSAAFPGAATAPPPAS